MDLALKRPELFELIEVMNDLTYREFTAMARTPARHLKLWENLTIETMGPKLFGMHLVPVYRRIFDILSRSGQRLCVHYDGKLRLIAEEIRPRPFLDVGPDPQRLVDGRERHGVVEAELRLAGPGRAADP